MLLLQEKCRIFPPVSNFQPYGKKEKKKKENQVAYHSFHRGK
jgi:hypothetical protein